jgi:hypothetical protein
MNFWVEIEKKKWREKRNFIIFIIWMSEQAITIYSPNKNYHFAEIVGELFFFFFFKKNINYKAQQIS